MHEVRRIGRYELFAELASGGMATVHLARLLGRAGFARTVAIKRLHPNFAKDPEFVSMFLDEARLAARIRHPNVVPVLDVESVDGELFLVMEYVHGESLSKIMRLMGGKPLAPGIAARIVADVLYGLHAAHEAKSERGEPLKIVHRDVSPQNVMVGVDGIARVTDFGVAKAVDRVQTTHEGQLKGKLSYMAPEQLEEKPVDRRSDVYAASVVLWEIMTGRRLHGNLDAGTTVSRILRGKMPAPSEVVNSIPVEVDEVVLRGLARDPDQRFSTAREMAIALDRAVRPDPSAEVAEWLQTVAFEVLEARANLVAELESSTSEREPGDDRMRAVELARERASSLSDGDPVTAPTGSSAASAASSAGDSQSKSSITVERSLYPKPRTRARLGLLIGVGVMLPMAIAVSIRLSRSQPPKTTPAAGSIAPIAPIAPSAEETPPSIAASELPVEPAPSASADEKPKTAKTVAPTHQRPAAKSSPKPKTAFGSLTRE